MATAKKKQRQRKRNRNLKTLLIVDASGAFHKCGESVTERIQREHGDLCSVFAVPGLCERMCSKTELASDVLEDDIRTTIAEKSIQEIVFVGEGESLHDEKRRRDIEAQCLHSLLFKLRDEVGIVAYLGYQLNGELELELVCDFSAGTLRRQEKTVSVAAD